MFQLAANDGALDGAPSRQWLQADANEGCNICASLAGLDLSFIACFILLVIGSLRTSIVGFGARLQLQHIDETVYIETICCICNSASNNSIRPYNLKISNVMDLGFNLR